MQSDKPAALNGSQILLKCLKNEGVEFIFGYPGGAVLPLYDALYDFEIPNILTRHEQGAVHAAQGYARVTGKPGVVIVTSGPGATNSITGIADAMSDSTPLIVITGQVSTHGIGKDAFQEADVLGITLPITKHNYQIRDVSQIQEIVHEAFHISRTGRPGPVVIDFPKNISSQMGMLNPSHTVNTPSYQPNFHANSLQIQKLMKALTECKKPLIVVGAGVIHAEASKLLRDFIQNYEIPVVETTLSLGCFPTTHHLHLGMGGMHGSYAANMALSECDFLINIGSRFADRLATLPSNFASGAKIAHIDIDPSEIGKIIPTDIPIVADAKDALSKMLAYSIPKQDYTDWINHCKKNQSTHPLSFDRNCKDHIKPQRVVELVGELTKGEAYVVTDVGQNQMWACQFYPFHFPRQMITSGGLGTMGYAIPAAIGVKFAKKHQNVVVFVGDGGFQMSNQELILINEYDLDIKFILLNNGVLGMVYQWQSSFHQNRYSSSIFSLQPDFMKLCDAYGIRSIKIQNPETFEEDFTKAFNAPGAVVIEVEIPRCEEVLPMVASGMPNHKMIGVGS